MTITQLFWGRIETSDGRRFKDLKVWPGGAREWDWNETGTRHVPGIQIADLEELVSGGASVVVLSRGALRQLRVPEETLAWLQQKGIATEVLPTRRAVKRFNQLVEAGRHVGGLFHSTC